MENLHAIADRLQLSRVSRALLCTCGSGVPEEQEHIIASLIGHAQMRLADFSCVYRIEYENRFKMVSGRVSFGTYVAIFNSAKDLLELLTEKYEILQQMDQ